MIKKFGYVRVSTTDQNTDRQLDGIQLDEIFEEKISGRTMERPQLQLMLGKLREGDEVYVHTLCRLARNTKDAIVIMEQIVKEKKATLVIEKFNFRISGTGTEVEQMYSTMFFLIFAMVAEFEVKMHSTRVKEGIAKAKLKGKPRKKPKSKYSDEFVTVLAQLYDADLSLREIAKRFNIPLRTVHYLLKTKQQ